MIFSLVQDFGDALAAVPTDHTRFQILKLLEEAVRRDAHFLDRHPTTLFQCLWNSCWWFDCPEAARHYDEPAGDQQVPPWAQAGERLHALTESWRHDKEESGRAACWLRSLRPPAAPLGTGQRLVLRSPQPIDSIAFSPDGSKIAGGASDGTVRVWSVETGQELITLEPPAEARPAPGGFWAHLSVTQDYRWQPVFSLAFCPDGRRVVGGLDAGVVCVWDADGGACLNTFTGHDGAVTGVAYLPDGERIASVGSMDKTVRVWDPANGVELSSVRTSAEEWITFGTDSFPASPTLEGDGFTFSRNGRRIAAHGGCTITVWDTETGRELARIDGSEQEVTAVALSADGARVAGTFVDGTIRVWEAETGREVAAGTGPEAGVASLSFSPDGRRVAGGSRDSTVWVWDADTGRELAALWGQEGRSDIMTCVAFSPDGRRVAAGSTGRVARVWDAEGGRERVARPGHDGGIVEAAFSRDGSLLATRGADGTVRLWEAKTARQTVALATGESASTCLAISPDGKRIATGSFDAVRLWDAGTGQEVAVLRGHEELIRAVAYSPDGRRIVSGADDRSVRVWDTATGRELAVLGGNTGQIYEVAFTPDGGRVVSGANDNKVLVWDVKPGRRVKTVEGLLTIVRGEPRVVPFGSGGPDSQPGWRWPFPVQLLALDQETVAEWDQGEGPVAWFPVPLNQFIPKAHSPGLLWAGGHEEELYLLQLEGFAVDSAGVGSGRPEHGAGNR